MRTRIEGLSLRDLLAEHLETNYPNANVLVIWSPVVSEMTDEDFPVWDELKETMVKYGYGIPSAIAPDCFIIMEMDDYIARAIINRFDKAPFRLESWHGGTCIHENR